MCRKSTNEARSDLDDEEVGPAEVAADVAHKSLHPPHGVFAPHGVGLALLPEQGGQLTASALTIFLKM